MDTKHLNRILVANRGEIALRIIRAIHQLDRTAIAVFADDDAGLHTSLADQAVGLGGTGPSAYLDVGSIITAAIARSADAIHPGYGFLSEDAALARACEETGLAFIGPSSQVLATFGDKLAARALAEKAGVAVPPGTSRPTTQAEALEFLDSQGPMMIKAVLGGGGRGMAEVRHADQLAQAFARCSSEARGSFGDGTLYVEKLLDGSRHLEVQVVADRHGAVAHLWERDCSIQRRHQKVIEVAPGPRLEPGIRKALLAAATRLATISGYQGVGTFEFLLNGSDFYFIEANPRLQVEHTVTEAITGIDLVATQILLAEGTALADCGLAEPPTPRGVAIEVRLNAETLDSSGTPVPSTGILRTFELPSGPGVRIDTAGHPGMAINPRYDSLLAKVIVTGEDFRKAALRAEAAISELRIEGVATNQELIKAILADEDFLGGEWNTSYIQDHLAGLLPPTSGATPHSEQPGVIQAPLSGTVIAVAQEGMVPLAGSLLVIEAMKMEHVVQAKAETRVVRPLVRPGDLVESGAPVMLVETAVTAAAPDAAEATHGRLHGGTAEGWAREVEEIARRGAFAESMGGPEKVARQHQTGRLTARERIEALADPGSFIEIGKLAGFATRDESGEASEVSPANFIAGTALLEGRKVALGVDDFTLRGGSGDAAIHAKQVFLEQYANQMRLPVVRLLDGQSGGGSVKMALEAGYTYVPVNPAWDAVVDNLSVVPVASACLGPTAGLGAARLVMSHLAVMVEGVGQLFVAGPPLVQNATGETLSKEALGGAEVHRSNGSVERIVRSESEAFEVIRRFLSYLPASAFEPPPVLAEGDPGDRRDESLLSAVPRSKRHPYAIWPILEAIFDVGSVFTFAEYGGGTVTLLARLDGHPVGVIAADPFKGATLTVEGAMAVTRLVDLCETFHLPIVSLTDQAGMSIGLEAERRATIRHGARAIASVYQARVPQAELILRRVYGVGGAGIVNRHRATRSWAWPSGDWGSLPGQGGVEAAFRSTIEAAADPESEVARLRHELTTIGSPFRTAEKFGVHDIIDPRESRPLLCDWVHDAYRLIPDLLGRPSFGTRP